MSREGSRQRPVSHDLGETGQFEVGKILSRWGWNANLIRSEYGEDLDCNVFADGRRTALYFRCQVKSTQTRSGQVRCLKSGDYSVRISTETAKSWLLSVYPVLIVVYDASTDQAFWADATAELRNRIDQLSQQTLTIRVPSTNDFREGRNEILHAVSAFYARILRLETLALECDVFPILMPRHRAVPLISVDCDVGMVEGITLEKHSRDLDSLPAWATSIRSLTGAFISGWTARSSSEDLEAFMDRVVRVIRDGLTPDDPDDWVTLLCSPVRFAGAGEDDARVPWTRKLTDWWCYPSLTDGVVSDYDFALAKPDNFIGQIARRARSWDSAWFVSTEHDVAVQLYAGAPTTHSVKSMAQAQRAHAQAQFTPWICPRERISELREILWTVQLVFNPLVDDSDTEVTGAISTPMFNPTVGLIPNAQNWAEVEEGSVQYKLDRAGLVGDLPGWPGPDRVRDEIMQMFGAQFGSPPEQAYVSGSNYTPGLPLDHSERLIWVQRFQRVDGDKVALIAEGFESFRHAVNSTLEGAQGLEVSWSEIDGILSPLVEISVSWRPLLTQSSVDALQAVLGDLCLQLDALLAPRVGEEQDGGTLDVLRLEGELYFEGDDPWGIRYCKQRKEIE